MTIIAIIDLLFLAFSAATILLLLVKWKSLCTPATRGFILGLLVSTLIYSFCLFMEWSGITTAFEKFEDIIGATLPMWWLLLINSLCSEVTMLDLSKSNERLEMAMEGTNDGLWDYSIQTGHVFYSPRWFTMLGYEPDEWPQDYKTWENLLHPDDKEKTLEILSDFLKGDRDLYSAEFRMIAKDNKWQWIHARAKASAWDENGNITRVVGTHTDITDRKKAYQALQENQNILESIMNNTPAVIYLKEYSDEYPKGRYLMANQEFLAMTHKRITDVIGKNDFDLFPHEVAEQFQEMDYQVLETGTALEVEEIAPRDDGNHTFLSVKFPINGNHGSSRAVGGISTDITDRKKAVDELAREKNFTEAVLESLPGIFFMYDKHLKLVRWNRNHEQLSGYDDKELKDMPVLDWFEGVDKERIAREIERLMKVGEARIQANFIIKNGDKIPYDFTGRLFRKESHDFFIGVGLDISESVRVQEKLWQANAKHERLVNNMFGTFLYRHGIDGAFTYVSSSIKSVLGFNPEEILDSFNKYFTDHLINKEAAEHTSLSISGIQQPPYELEVYSKDGKKHWLEVAEIPVRDEQRRVIAVEGVAHDITERKHAEDQLQAEEERYRTLFESAGDGIISLENTENGPRFRNCNTKATELFGCGKNDLIGKSPVDFSPLEQPDGIPSSRKARDFIESALSGESQFFSWTHIKKDGTPFDAEVTLTRVKTSKKTYLQSIVRDVTKRKKIEAELEKHRENLEDLVSERTIELNNANESLKLEIIERQKLEEKLRGMATIDGLTNIPNRRAFDEKLDRDWHQAMRGNSLISLVMIDVDYFKKFNDSCGHQAGDECLKLIAEALRNSVKRAGDMVARYGGEEFSAILPGTSSENAMKVCKNMQQAVEALKIEHPNSDVSKYVTMSMGLATVTPQKDEDTESLITQADNALYKAKKSGRNRVCVNED